MFDEEIENVSKWSNTKLLIKHSSYSMRLMSKNSSKNIDQIEKSINLIERELLKRLGE